MHNIQLGHEDASEEPNSTYNTWAEAMKDVKFQGRASSASKEKLNNQENEKTSSIKRMSEAIQKIRDTESERSDESFLNYKTEIICDGDHIENQRINIVEKKAKNSLELNFKLRSPNQILESLSNTITNNVNTTNPTTTHGSNIRQDKYSYGRISLCDAYVLEKNGITITIANPYSDNEPCRAAIGLVKAEIPDDIDSDTASTMLNEMLEQDLGIPNAFEEVSQQSETEYKLARLRWQHVDKKGITPEQVESVKNLERKEVVPGYSTFIEKDKHIEYLEKYGKDIRAIHCLKGDSPNMLFSILTNGLMSTAERFSRGLTIGGLSSIQDFTTGGADSVFTRIANKSQREDFFNSGTVIVFKPELFDRTDWYSYDDDKYGTTEEQIFEKRLSPDETFEQTLDANIFFKKGNEQMFRTGIGPDYIESIEVDEKEREYYINHLKSLGLEEVNGKPIEEIILPHPESIDELARILNEL